MALSFPRALPSPARFATCNMRPEYTQAIVPTRGAENPAADLGPELWLADVQTAKMTAADFREWRAWLKSLRGASRTFLMTDPDYAAPAAYPAGSGWGSPTVAAFDQAARTIDLQALTAGAVLAPGDRFHIVYATSSHYALFEITEGGTANGSGELTVSVEPDILDGIATSDSCVFLNPSCEMRMQPGTVEAPDELTGVGAVKFQAVQVRRKA